MGECPQFAVNYEAMTTDFLFARPSRLSGLARLLDLFCVFQLYNVSPNQDEADCRATFSDWVMVGQDLRRATELYAQSAPVSEESELANAQP